MLRNVPQDDLDSLLADAVECSFAAGDTLLKQGEASAFALILLTGEVAIVNESAHGDAPLAVTAAPALIGEIGALSQLRRTAGVRARTDITALEIRRESLLLVARHEPELLMAVIAQTGQQMQNLNAALGLYAAGLAALERDDLDAGILADLNNPTPDLSNFAEAFQRLAQRVTMERRSRAELASAALIQRAMLPAPIARGAIGGPVHGVRYREARAGGRRRSVRPHAAERKPARPCGRRRLRQGRAGKPLHERDGDGAADRGAP